MFRCAMFLAFATFSLVVTACQSSRYSSAGFHLPDGGDAAKGQADFVALGCHSCHEVTGVDLPKPTAAPAVTVVLGGEVDQRLSDAYLITSMLDPSHALALYPKSQITVDGHSRMPSYADQLGTRQMIDIVAFLQSRYSVRRWEPRYVYPG